MEKRSKKRHSWTEKQKGKSRLNVWKHSFAGMKLWFQQGHTDRLDANCKDFFDENYVHPTRTGRGTAKWDWW